MHVRCPHCHQPVELVENVTFEQIECPSCGSQFSLLGDATATHHGGDATSIRAGEAKTIGRFQLIERLGMGQFGTVWMARDTQLDRTVAVKIPRREQLSRDDLEIFLREARAAAQLHHPNIVSVHEVGRDGDAVFIVSDLVRGMTLADWLTGKHVSPRETAVLCVTIADALHHAHRAGVIHRDLKPSNIMIDASGQPHLMDFGLAKREAGEITMTIDGKILGTPAYMSPEQARGEAHFADARSDVYSLGTILFEMLTGMLPFRGNARMLIMQIVTDEPPRPNKLNAAVPRDLETICLKCLEKSPARRYATAADVAEELRRYLDGRPILARRIGRPQRAWRWCRRNPLITAAAASLFCAAAISSYLGLHAWRKGEEADVNAAAAQRSATQATELATQFQAVTEKAERQEQTGYEERARAAVDRVVALRSARVPGRQKQALVEISAALALRGSMAELPAAETVDVGTQNEKLWRELIPRLCDEAVFWLSDASSRVVASADSPAPPRPDGPNMAVEVFQGSGHVFDPAVFARDGRRLARLSRPTRQRQAEVQLSDVGTGNALWTTTLTPYLQVASWTMAFSVDGERLFAVRLHRGHKPTGHATYALFVEELDVESGKLLRANSVALDIDRNLDWQKYAPTIVFSPDREKVIVLEQDPPYGWESRRVSCVVDIKNEKQLWSQTEADIRLRTFTPDGSQVVGFRVIAPQAAAWRHEPVATAVEFRDALTGTKIKQFDLSPPWATIAGAGNYPWISPDGKWVMGFINLDQGLGHYPIGLIEAETGRLARTVSIPRQGSVLRGGVPLQGPLGLGVFTNDGRFLVVAGEDTWTAISIPEGAVIHRQAIRLKGGEETDPNQVLMRQDKPTLTRLELLDDSTRLAVGVAASPGRHFGQPLPEQELVDVWDLSLPRLTLETRIAHAGLLKSARLDGRRLYLAGDSSYGVGALDLDFQRPAVLSFSQGSAGGNAARTAFEGLVWLARGLPVQSPDSWYGRIDRHGASGFDASGHGFVLVDDFRPSIGWFDITTGQVLNETQFGQLSADRRRAVFCSENAAHVFELADKRELARFEGAYWCGRGIYLSPRGNYLLTADGQTLHIARVADGTTTIVSLPFTGFASSPSLPVVFSDDETSVLVIGYEKTMLVDLAQNSQVVTLDIPRPSNGNPVADGALKHIAFFRAEPAPAGADGIRFPGEEVWRLYLWNSGDEAPLPLGETWQRQVIDPGNPLTFTADGSRLIVHAKAEDHLRDIVEIWDVENRRLLGSTRDRPGSAEFYVLFDAAARLGVYLQDRTAKSATELLDLRTGQRIAAYPQARLLWPAGVYDTKHAREAGTTALLIQAAPASYSMIDLLTGEQVAQVPRMAPANLPARLGDPSGEYRSALGGDLRVTRDRARLTLWWLKDRRHVPLPPEANVFLGFSPDGRQVATFVFGTDDSFRLWDTSTGESLGAITPFAGGHLAGQGQDHIDFTQFAPDGQRLAVRVASQIRFIDLQSRKTYATLPRIAPLGPVSSLAITGDGRLLATGDASTVEFRDAASGEFRGLLDGFGSPVTGVAFLDGDRRLATLDGGGKLVMWQLEPVERGGRPTIEGKVLWRVSAGDSSALAVSGDQKSICTIAEDGQPAVFASSDGKLVRRLTAPGTSAFEFATDGKLLITGSTDGKLRAFLADTGELHAEWSADQGAITTLAFDPTGRFLASAGRDLRVWRVADQQRLLTLATDEAQVHELRFASDGKHLLCTQTNPTGTESEIRIIDHHQLTNALMGLGFEPRDLFD